MVRETRHLWVGNLPDNIREDRIREHFKRYGRVQNVKLLGRAESAGTGAGSGASGNCATVAFMDIKSASKAHNAEHVLDERTLTTEYYEPAAIPAAGAPSAGSSPAGSGYSGSSSSVNSAPAPPAVAPPARYHATTTAVGAEENASSACALAATAAAPANWRGTNDSASDYRRGTTPASYTSRSTPHHRWYAGSGERAESTPSTPGDSTRRRPPSGSGSSRSGSSSPEPSDTSRASTPAGGTSQHHNHHHQHNSHHQQWSSSTSNGRPLAICVRNLPTRSTDSSLKDGLYHEYKKHGKVVWVKVVGQNADRYAVVRFKKPSDVEKALEVSQDKLFFGCKISVAPHQSCDEDAESAKPYETDIDEYHPKATRTLFIGNLEKDITQQQLREKFKHFGRIIEIDIKKGSGGGAGYAFCQYASISSVVEAIRAMDGEYVGNSRVKLGFGKPVATTCVWVDGLTEHTEKQVLGAVSRCGGATSVCVDRAAGAALVHFEQASAAGVAVRELRRVAAHASAAQPDHPRLCVDYASRECQEAFYEQLEKHGGSSMAVNTEVLGGTASNRYPPAARHDARYEGGASRSRASSYARSSSRTPRFPSLDHYEPADYPADRRVYDDLGASPQPEDSSYEDRLQSVVVSPHRSRRHRRDSSPGDRKHSKERHRSSGGSVRRSRSGSRSHGERHSSRRRHRRRREDGTESLASRAGTPLRDELENMLVEPRRPPRERPPLPMSLPLPKFAVQLLRSVPSTPRPAPAPAPASPSRPPSVSSSSGGSAPHSPSLEERIRSLDEKYEKWSGSRALADAPDRTRLRHRLLEVDINEVKPSEVVLSLLSKRSVFDEDSERLEGAARAPSPTGSPRARMIPPVPRALRYPFPVHPPQSSHSNNDGDTDNTDRLMQDPRINRSDRLSHQHPSPSNAESDHKLETRLRLRTPSIDKLQTEISERRPSLPGPDKDRSEATREKRDLDRRKLDVTLPPKDIESSSLADVDQSSIKETAKKRDSDSNNKDKLNTSLTSENRTMLSSTSSDKRDRSDDKLPPVYILKKLPDSLIDQKENNRPRRSSTFENDESNSHKEIMDSLLKEIGNDCVKLDSVNQQQTQDTAEEQSKEVHVKLNHEDTKPASEGDISSPVSTKNAIEKGKEVLFQNHISRQAEIEIENYLNSRNSKDISEINQDCVKSNEKNGKERFNQNILVEALNTKLEKENIEFEKDKLNSSASTDKKHSVKVEEEKVKTDRDKLKSHKRSEKDKHESEREKSKDSKQDKANDRHDRDKKQKDDNKNNDKTHSPKIEKDSDKHSKEKSDHERSKESSRHHDHHKKDKSDKDKKDKKDHADGDDVCEKTKKEEKHKHDKYKRDTSEKRDHKKDSDSGKARKSSRDESAKDLSRKDSTDSLTSKASHDSNKSKDFENVEGKEEHKSKVKHFVDIPKIKTEKEAFKPVESIKIEKIDEKHEEIKVEEKIKIEIKEEKDHHHQGLHHHVKSKNDNNAIDNAPKSRSEAVDKQRHYSLDSQNTESKRKERLNSCSSLPPSIGHKRRVSSQDNFDSLIEESKKIKTETKCPERRDSKDSRSSEKHKSTKFNKGHFAKLIESKTKDDKNNQVKTHNDARVELNDSTFKDRERTKSTKKSPKEESDIPETDLAFEGLKNDLDFLATLQLRSSEEDEKQKALTNEMKEKKRIQQLQQIQELQMQHDALLKENKNAKTDEKRKEIAREKRMSTDRKSKDEKSDGGKRKNRKHTNSTDSSDSDEPKKHSIFDIVDEGPTYISMYDKVKARSCKNMQKQEEEKRQEKIKAKFSQLKQSRAKRQENKRSSWDEDSDSDNDKRKGQKPSMDSSSEDDQIVLPNKKRDQPHNTPKICEFYNIASTDEDSRNKLSCKNSRTRIISDTSDDDFSKKWGSSPHFFREKDLISDSEIRQQNKNDEILVKESFGDKIKKNSLLNLFGKSDNDDNKIKSNLDIVNEYKSSFVKASSVETVQTPESDLLSNNKYDGEIRKKHKKKQKKHSFSLSDDDNGTIFDVDTKHKSSHRHSNRKEKRKEKTRESIDTDDQREDKSKSKKNKKHFNHSVHVTTDSAINSINVKKEVDKMEDIFGSFTDDSDRDTKDAPATLNLTPQEFHNSFSNDVNSISTSNEINRKKDKKRKEKRFIAKEDENSLDVDAVSKAIEARLCEDSNDANNTITCDVNLGLGKDLIVSFEEKHSEKARKDNKEKKKKKKKNKEDRQNRKDHFLELLDKTEKSQQHESPKSDTDAIIMESDSHNSILPISEKESENKPTSDSSSLPILLDSPPSGEQQDKAEATDIAKTISTDITESQIDSDNKLDANKFAPSSQSIKIPETNSHEQQTIKETPHEKENDLLSFEGNVESSENAVRSIPSLESEKKTDGNDSLAKHEEKIEEKPRAIISQEETEDAVAALLGESFGGKADAFSNRYDEPDNNTINRMDLDNVAMSTENIPEEDAEEMRRAVQNLNASEMEMKPDTPVSDTDLLLIDTDTEEAEESAQEVGDKTQVNVDATSQPHVCKTDLSKSSVSPINTVIAKTEAESKKVHIETNIHFEERDQKSIKTAVQHLTSTATPVITSWTLTNKNLIEPRVLNLQPNQLPIRDSNQNKATHITANIVQIKTPQGQNLQINGPRPIITTNRVTAPYQIINQMIRAQGTNVQPPTIKIPDTHILYPKQGIVISPRLQNDPRLLSPKSSSPIEKMPSPRITNMTILNTSSQNVGMVSPNALPQRSPGQVTVVRMQQPPLSPIQAVHLPHGARMLSPRPNSVLVQTQAPLFNRLPVTPVLAPISKQVSSSNTVTQNKNAMTNTSSTLHQQKVIAGDIRKLEQRSVNENLPENAKIILSPTSFQAGQNPTVAAQNRLISMQNALSAANVSPTIHLTNKVLISNVSHLSDKKENIERSLLTDSNNSRPSQIIHVTGQSATSFMQSGSKQVSLQDVSTIGRGQQSNVIHSLGSQRLLTTAPITNVIMDANKSSPSILSVAAIRSPTVLTKLDSSKTVAATTSTLTNVVMTPVLFKPAAPGTIRLTPKNEHIDRHLGLQNSLHREENKYEDNLSSKLSDVMGKQNLNSRISPVETIAKCETDFEELLKDNTNEIKVTNDGQKKLEVNVGKAVTVFTALAPSPARLLSDDTDKEPEFSKDSSIQKSLPDNQDQIEDQKKSDSEVHTNSFMMASNDLTSSNQNELPKGSLQSSNATTISNTKTGSKIFSFIEQSKDIKNDDNDSWSAKDVNIDSVIKKVDSLCNDNLSETVTESNVTAESSKATEKPAVDNKVEETISDASGAAPSDDMQHENIENEMFSESNDKFGLTRRGGRSARGKKPDKNLERVQTRQICKPARGTGARRGRGRGKIDKKVNSVPTTNTLNNLPADVYDFHEEDSGDESSSSPNKGEPRPRLILTIKSPLSGQSNVIATSTLSISSKDQGKTNEKIDKDEKSEDFIAPSANTRKSRRLLEKDRVAMTDEVIEEQGKNAKEAGKKRPIRQAGAKLNQQDNKVCDTRKSPRGAKRTRDRSISDASADSGEERPPKEDQIQKEPTPSKVAKLAEPIAAKPPVETPIISKPTPTPAVVPIPAPASASTTPIMKPPKKMISEISAKLASVFGASTTAEQPSERMETEKPSGSIRDLCTPEPAPELAAATGDASGGDVRRPDNAPYVMMPVGASEASEARVQSPALPHRPPSTHRPMPADRATPVLIRGGDGSGAGYSRAAPAPAPRYAGMASLPRGAHHPPPAPAPAPAAPSHLLTHKQVAVVGPHLHHPAPGATSRVTHTSVPAISPQGQLPMGEGPFGHFSQHHYQMYQQHFRATQHDFRTPSPFSRTLEAEGCETPTATGDVYRSRPTSARVPRPAHSPIVHHDIHERLVFGGCTRSPPPAHVVRPPASLPPPAAPGPPHASQVPREADSLQMLLRRYPVMWQGLLALKNDSAAVQMHWVGGNPTVAGDTLPRHTDGSTPPLRIAQRMRLEQQQLDQVHRKMKMESEHCMLLALPCGRDHMDVLQQSTNLTHGFITYLQRKQAAGIVNVAPPGHHQAMYTVHIFPSCDFANENLNRIAPDLMHRVADIAHLLIVIATV